MGTHNIQNSVPIAGPSEKYMNDARNHIRTGTF
jgi:hypothetical protein